MAQRTRDWSVPNGDGARDRMRRLCQPEILCRQPQQLWLLRTKQRPGLFKWGTGCRHQGILSIQGHKLLTQGTHYIYNIDLSNQKTAKPDAFLYADNAKSVSKTNYKANLELRPVLSMMKLTLVPGADITEDIIKKMTIRLKGMPTTALFDLLKGDFMEGPTQQSNVKTDLSINSDLTVSIVMLPDEMSKYATIEVTIPAEGNIEEKTMSWSLNNAVQLMEKNTQYFVMLKIGNNGVTGELTGQSLIYIQDWGHSDDVNGDARQNKNT